MRRCNCLQVTKDNDFFEAEDVKQGQGPHAQLKCCMYKKGYAVKQHELLGYANYSEADKSFKINVQAWRSRSGASKEDKNLWLALVE